MPLVLVVSALSALLFYWRVLPVVVRGFFSQIDGSVQPYSVNLPADYGKDKDKPYRLDIVLHPFAPHRLVKNHIAIIGADQTRHLRQNLGRQVLLI